MKHFFDINTLFNIEIDHLLDQAISLRTLMKNGEPLPQLGSSIIGMSAFFEPSTRTLLSFQMAAYRLGAQFISLPSQSSISKGETMRDTILNMDAMQPDFIVIRDTADWAVHDLVGNTKAALINAGSGTRHHPTQALLDTMVIERRCGVPGDKARLGGLTVAICGDVRHSRVAASNAQLLTRLGANVRLVGPKELLPSSDDPIPFLTNPIEPSEGAGSVSQHTDMMEGIEGADVIMMLRMQLERQEGQMDRSSYIDNYCLTMERLTQAGEDALVMHPGPMNRGVEITDEVANSSSAILEQVEDGVAARMSVLLELGRNRF